MPILNFMDPILPRDLSPVVRTFIYVLVLFHLLAVLYWVMRLIKDAVTPRDEAVKKQLEVRAKKILEETEIYRQRMADRAKDKKN